MVEVPCANGIDPILVIDALQLGFDGVMVFICAAEDCKLKEGRQSAEANFVALEKILKKLNLYDRFELCETSLANRGTASQSSALHFAELM